MLSIIATTCLLTVCVPAVFGFNLVEKLTKADTVYACTSVESLTSQATNSTCSFDRPSFNTYTSGCTTGVIMDSLCVVSTPKTCADFYKAVVAENGLCKIDPNQLSSVLISTVSDVDGRQCNGEGFNLKRYNADSNTGNGPVICSNIFSVTAGKENFRFLPANIGNTDIIRTITSTELSACPNSYTTTATKCVRSATPKTCDKNGEIFTGTTCQPCPSEKICLVTNPIVKTTTVCPNGGTLENNQCVAENKISQINYTDGCHTGYVRMYNSCAVIEARNHDLGCTYFYASANINVKAINSTTVNGNAMCSTGGRSDFSTTSIVRISDIECNGANTYWYNYNVGYDPLVCGNDLTVVGKTGFVWTALTYTKVTTLHKIPTTIRVCPVGWMEISSTKCAQPPVTQEYRDCVATICGSSSSAVSSINVSSANVSSAPVSSQVSSLANSSVISSQVSSTTPSSNVVSVVSSQTPSSVVASSVISSQISSAPVVVSSVVSSANVSSMTNSSIVNSSVVSSLANSSVISSANVSSNQASSQVSSMNVSSAPVVSSVVNSSVVSSANQSSIVFCGVCALSSVANSSTVSSMNVSSSNVSSANVVSSAPAVSSVANSSVATSSQVSSNVSSSSFVPVITKCEITKNGVVVAIVTNIISENWNTGFYSELKFKNMTNQDMTNWYVSATLNSDQNIYSSWELKTDKSGQVIKFTSLGNIWNKTIPANNEITLGGMAIAYTTSSNVLNITGCGVVNNTSSSAVSSVNVSSAPAVSSATNISSITNSSQVSSKISSACVCGNSSSNSSSSTVIPAVVITNNTTNNWFQTTYTYFTNNYLSNTFNNWYNNLTNNTTNTANNNNVVNNAVVIPAPAVNVVNTNVNTNTNNLNTNTIIVPTVATTNNTNVNTNTVNVIPAVVTTTQPINNTNVNVNTNTIIVPTVATANTMTTQANTNNVNTNNNTVNTPVQSNLVRTGGINIIAVIAGLISVAVLSVLLIARRNRSLLSSVKNWSKITPSL